MTERRMGRPAAIPGDKPTAEKILDAAIDRFAEDGFESTSVKSVALSLGLTESAVYRHYKSKEALLEAIFEFADRFVFAPLPAESAIGKKTDVSIFRGLLSPLPDLITGDGTIVKIMRIMFIEMHRDERIRKRYEAEYVDKADDLMESIFSKCIAAGEVVPCDARSLARVFNSVRSEWAYRNFVVRRDAPPDADALARELEEMIAFFERHFSVGGYHSSP
jgi:AcrR family transcriptional regulator